MLWLLGQIKTRLLGKPKSADKYPHRTEKKTCRKKKLAKWRNTIVEIRLSLSNVWRDFVAVLSTRGKIARSVSDSLITFP